ncbi:MAG: heavy metal-associated domain-containing protein [Candidatus Buchananbacteria bacterium]|jgi:Cu+-exporting ATPase
MEKINFKLAGLTCDACVKLAGNRLRKLPGVIDVKIDLASGSAQVASEIIIDRNDLQKSLEGTDYKIVN